LQTEIPSIDADLINEIKLSCEPKGYRILIADVPVEEKTQGGILLPGSVQEVQRGVCMIGQVVSLGKMAYTREDMVDHEDWCEEGNMVVFSKYAGVRFRVNDHPCRILNDDEIQAVMRRKDAIT
tara:strand:- start:200 stop:571 length:372 start_codon:yes stop_codon:yes gene_type:complete